MATTLKMAAKNTAPYWQITCQRSGTSINLTGCIVTLIIAKGAVITQASGACTILDATNGIIKYTPTATDVPSSGSYKVDVKVTYGDSSYEVLYEQLKVKARSTIL